jgi:hypothetical protein
VNDAMTKTDAITDFFKSSGVISGGFGFTLNSTRKYV